MLQMCYVDKERQWDKGVHFVLFAARESIQESLGFGPFKLVFGQVVCGPLKLIKEAWLGQNSTMNLLDHVSDLREKLHTATELAKEKLKSAQQKMKVWYDKKAQKRTFKPGDKVLVILPIPGHPLQARYCGLYVIEKKVNEVVYVVHMPERRKQRGLCHINMLKKYYIDHSTQHPPERPLTVAITSYVTSGEIVKQDRGGPIDEDFVSAGVRLRNSNVLANLDNELSH